MISDTLETPWNRSGTVDKSLKLGLTSWTDEETVFGPPGVDKTQTRDSRSWTTGQICDPAAGRIKRAVTFETLSLYPGFEISFFHSGSWPKVFQFFFAS
jgi:hypothetical protein